MMRIKTNAGWMFWFDCFGGSYYVIKSRHNSSPVDGSASPVLTATGFVNGRGQFSTPHKIHTPKPIIKKFGMDDYVSGPY